MIEQLFIIAILTLSIWYTMQPDEIFGKLGDWFEDHLPEKIHPPVFACNVCLCPWYGSVLYWLIPWQHVLWQWPVVVIGAMGVNIIINKWTPEKKEAKKENDMIPEKILQAYERVKKTTFLESKSLYGSEWKALFEYYNSNLSDGQRPLNMGCVPCYQKVLSFVDSKIKQAEVQ